MTWPAPSDTVTGPEQEDIPDTASLHENVTVTSSLCHPAAFGSLLNDALMVGRVLSMLKVTLVVEVFPAKSTAEPGMIWLAPSVATVIGSVQLSTPETASLQENLTTTSELFHPLPFAAGVAAAEIVGAALSILIDNE
jgi:hypothetical protein